MEWAEDSLFIDEISDSLNLLNDSTQIDNGSQKDIPHHDLSQKKEIVEKPKDTSSTLHKKSVNINITDSTNEKSLEFSAPKAISLEQAYSLFNKGVVFIDARDESDFLAGHILNSINIPFDDFDNHKQKLFSISKKKPVVIYCAGTECDLSHLLANMLFEKGYKQVYVFFGGWGEWNEADYPVIHQSGSSDH